MNAAKQFVQTIMKFKNFTGRTNKPEFWSFITCATVINIAWLAILMYLDSMHMRSATNVLGWLWLIFNVLIIVPTIAVTVRRLRDAGANPWILVAAAASIAVHILVKYSITSITSDPTSAGVITGVTAGLWCACNFYVVWLTLRDSK